MGMLRARLMASILSVPILISGAHAQEACTGLLTYLGRDQTRESRTNAIARDIYDSHCEGSSMKSGSNTSVGLGAVVEAIPINFSFGSGTNEEKLSNFCKTYSEKYLFDSSLSIDTSIVVRETLYAFNKCIELSKKDIYFYPNISTTQFVVDVRRGSDDADILGFAYDNTLLACTAPSSDSSNTTVVVDQNTRKALSGDFYPVTCVRKPKIQPDGTTEYPKATLTISTSRSSFLMPVDGDTEVSMSSIKDMKSEFEKVSKQIEVLNSRKPKFECRMIQSEMVAGRNPGATVRIPPAELAGGFVAVGGGCLQGSNQNMFRQSNPTTNGWECGVSDMPGVEVGSSIQAYLVYCRVGS